MASFREAISHMTRFGIARTNRFNVIISLPGALQSLINQEAGQAQDGGDFLRPLIGEEGINLVRSTGASGNSIIRGLDIMCETAEIPGKSFATSETKYNGDYFSAPYGITYNPITIRFVVSRDFVERNIMDKWMNLIVDPNSHTIAYFNDFVAPVIEIQQTNELDELVHKVQLKDAYPSEISAQPLSNEDKDNFHRISVTFRYRSWQNVDSEGTAPEQSQASDLPQLGPAVEATENNSPGLNNARSYINQQDSQFAPGTESGNIYGQARDVVNNTTPDAVQSSTNLLRGVKQSTQDNPRLDSNDKNSLINVIDNTISRMN